MAQAEDIFAPFARPTRFAVVPPGSESVVFSLAPGDSYRVNGKAFSSRSAQRIRVKLDPTCRVVEYCSKDAVEFVPWESLSLVGGGNVATQHLTDYPVADALVDMKTLPTLPTLTAGVPDWSTAGGAILRGPGLRWAKAAIASNANEGTKTGRWYMMLPLAGGAKWIPTPVTEELTFRESDYEAGVYYAVTSDTQFQVVPDNCAFTLLVEAAAGTSVSGFFWKGGNQ